MAQEKDEVREESAEVQFLWQLFLRIETGFEKEKNLSANGAATESNRKSFVKFYKASDNKTIRIKVENDIYVSANGQLRPEKG